MHVDLVAVGLQLDAQLGHMGVDHITLLLNNADDLAAWGLQFHWNVFADGLRYSVQFHFNGSRSPGAGWVDFKDVRSNVSLDHLQCYNYMLIIIMRNYV